MNQHNVKLNQNSTTMGPFVSQTAQMLTKAANQFVHSTGFKYLVVTNAKRGFEKLKKALE